MGDLWTAICSGAVAAASVALLLLDHHGIVEVSVGMVLVLALAVLARAAIRLASGPVGSRSRDKQP